MPAKKKKSVNPEQKKKITSKIKHTKTKKIKYPAKKKIKHATHKKTTKSKHAIKKISRLKAIKKTKSAKHIKAKKSKSLIKANLLITYDHARAGTAKEELAGVLAKINEEFEVLPTEIQGLFEVKVDDARLVIKKAAGLFKDKPHLFKATFHWSPIDMWCKSDINSMQQEIKRLVPEIKANEKWKMEINKREYPKHFNEIIIPLTEPVNRDHVDLENPRKIIRIEIISDKAGISLIKPSEVLNLPELRQKK